MKVAFVTNRLTHHQTSFCNALRKREGCDFRVILCRPIELGKEAKYPNYSDFGDILWELYDSNAAQTRIREFIDYADVVIIGSAPDALIVERLKKKRLTFKFSERFYKNGTPLKRLPRDIAGAWLHHGRFRKYPLYMLCASAYTAGDAARFGNYKNRCYKWGYFPQTMRYGERELLQKKDNEVPVILWAGRFLDWKHPDDALCVAERLKQNGYRFELNLIGNGEMEQQLRQMIRDKNLEDCVHLLGAMPPEAVRQHMERANIYLFTSDRNEGWGAVLNESMNSGCAVVASRAIGSVPFLVEDGKNGLIYESGNVDMLCEKVKYLLDKPDERKRLGLSAYRTIAESWNAEMAAKRLVELSERLLSGEKYPEPFASGLCSKAEVISD